MFIESGKTYKIESANHDHGIDFFESVSTKYGELIIIPFLVLEEPFQINGNYWIKIIYKNKIGYVNLYQEEIEFGKSLKLLL